MKVKVEKGKNKTATIKPELLMNGTLAEVLSDKVGTTVEQSSIISFDGKKAVYSAGEVFEFTIPEEDLIDMSITQWVHKYLKSKAKIRVTFVGKSGN